MRDLYRGVTVIIMQKEERVLKPHLIKHSHLFEADDYECSECHSVFRRLSSTCPNCGASLRTVLDRQEWVDEAEEINLMLGD